MKTYFPGNNNLNEVTDICFAAHQDDIEIMAYGPISECYENSERHFAGVVVTDGAGSPRAGEFANYTDEQMKEIRVLEQQKAADIGKYSVAIQLEYPSSVVKDSAHTEVIDDIFKILMEVKPKRVYTHNPADKHLTHIAVALRTISAVKEMPKEFQPEVFVGLEVWRALDWLPDEDKICIKTDKYPDIARELLTVHRSQVVGGKRYDNAAIGRRYANATFFASHNTDNCDSMNFGIDLKPLLNCELDVKDYIFSYIDKFKASVKEALEVLE